MGTKLTGDLGQSIVTTSDSECKCDWLQLTYAIHYVRSDPKFFLGRKRVSDEGCNGTAVPPHETPHMAILTSKRESPPGTLAYIFGGSQVDLNQVFRKIQYIWQQTVSLFEFGMVSGGSRLLIKVNRNLFNIICKMIIIHNIQHIFF